MAVKDIEDIEKGVSTVIKWEVPGCGRSLRKT